jgi:hypothetical protein
MADYEAQGLALKAIATAGTRAARLMPVGCNTDFPFQLSTAVFTAGFQAMSKSLHYLPKGGRNLRLLLVGGAYASAVETANASGFPLKLAIAREPAPWNPATTYAPGDMVSYYATVSGGGSFNGNPYFVCATANTASPPTPGNANWTPGTRPATYPVRVGGVQDATFSTQTTPDGTVVSRAWLRTDVLPISFDVPGWLGVYSWMPCSGSQVFPIWGQQQPQSLGSSLEYAASIADKTSGTVLSTPRNASVPSVTPAGIVGVPAQAAKSAIVIGDSIAQGKFPGAAPSIVLASGGTGYKVGDILTLARSGATPGAVASGSDARVIVDGVSSGVITAIRTLATGGYADTSSQTGQTRPSGTLGLTGGSGSGATVTVGSYGANAYDDGDPVTGGQGWIKRALLAIGVPHASFTASGDRLNLWTGNAGRRLSAMGELGADIAIIALGRNDLSAHDSAATIEANFGALVAMLKGLGIARVYGVTLTPETTSTSAAGQSTLADQVVTSNDPVRQAVNAWMRGAGHPFDAVLDVAALIEDGGATTPTGRFTPIGGEPLSADGKHPGTAGVLAMMPAITGRPELFA